MNWGIGHATRCIPIINQLLKLNFNPIIASDGDALLLLQKEFPFIKTIELPSYHIQYPKNGKFLKWKLLLDSLRIIRAIRKEKKKTQEIVAQENISGIISDNRYGVYSKGIPSVFITHQLTVLSGNTSFISSKIQQKLIQKFDECWIPDVDLELNFSGNLSKSKNVINSKYLGLLSRFQKEQLEIKYDLIVLLSGVETARKRLEVKLTQQLSRYNGTVLFVKGQLEENQKHKVIGNSTYVNFLLSHELEKAINGSKLIIARSGYSTIMDLAILEKKAFFIPTTGQYEQEYLASYLEEIEAAPFSSEKEFKIEMLDRVVGYKGLKYDKININSELFDLFHRK
ncbi:MAG: glycosyltransferase [Urechidicola sp.]